MRGILERKPVKVGLVLALLAILGWSVSPAIVTAEATPCDSELRHKIRLIHHRPGDLTKQELRHIQNLKDRIRDTDCNATTENNATTEKPSDNQYKPRNLLNDNGDDGGGD